MNTDLQKQMQQVTTILLVVRLMQFARCMIQNTHTREPSPRYPVFLAPQCRKNWRGLRIV